VFKPDPARSYAHFKHRDAEDTADTEHLEIPNQCNYTLNHT